MQMDEFDQEIESSNGAKKNLRGTLRKINRGKCQHESEIIAAHSSFISKNETTVQFLMDCIGSSSQPDMIKLNIFSRLDDIAINKLVQKMFCVTTKPNSLVIEEGKAGEMFYVVFQGTFAVTVDKNNPMNKRRNSVSKTGVVENENGIIQCDVLERGQVFGEGALLNATRLASVRCNSSSMYNQEDDTNQDSTTTTTTNKRQGGILYGLHRDSYQRVVKEYEQR